MSSEKSLKAIYLTTWEELTSFWHISIITSNSLNIFVWPEKSLGNLSGQDIQHVIAKSKEIFMMACPVTFHSLFSKDIQNEPFIIDTSSFQLDKWDKEPQCSVPQCKEIGFVAVISHWKPQSLSNQEWRQGGGNSQPNLCEHDTKARIPVLKYS